MITQRGSVPDIPYLCVSEAKKDDFDKGMAQCFVEMQTMAEMNVKSGKNIDVYGIVTNGRQWQFYRRDTSGVYYETTDFFASDAPRSLGVLDLILAHCVQNLVM